MIINFANAINKQTPSGVNGMTVSLVESDSALPVPVKVQNADIDTETFTVEEKQTLDAFIALIKSKL